MAKMVEKVKRLMDKPEQIRNIAICAHIDHGKTTLSDNLLAGAGMMSEELAGEALQLDFHEDETERGITIDSASVSMVHDVDDKEFLINLIDTPGHVDFGGDVTRAMRAVDGAVVLCDASEGIMPQTETVLRQALKERVKPILFINKVDRLIKELKLGPEEMKEKFTDIINHLNKLIKKIAEEEYGEKWQTNVKDGSVCFGSALHKWAMSIDYMNKKNISFKEVIDAYQSGSEKWKKLCKKAPLHEVFLDAVIKHHPDPKEASQYRIPKIWNGELESPLGKSLVNCDPDGQPAFVVTKVVVDPQAGEIAAGRLYSGTMEKGMNVYMNQAKQNVRTQQVYVYNGAKRAIVDEAPAGNIIGIGGLSGAYPGETVTLEKEQPFEEIKHLFEPVVTKAIEAKKPSDLPKLIDVLVQIGKEDPSIEVDINQETGEHLISGMGELHLEIVENRIKKEKDVDITTSPPVVVYRESILSSSPEVMGKTPNKHNKIFFTVEPMPKDLRKALKEDKIKERRVKKKHKETIEKLSKYGLEKDDAKKVKSIKRGNVLIDSTRGIVQLEEIMEMVCDIFEEVMDGGPLAKEPCINTVVRLQDAKLHEDAIHRGPSQMYPALRDAIKGAIEHAHPMIFEPIQKLRFEAPSEYMGEISKLISNKRGQLLDMEQEGGAVTVIGKLPVREMFGLSSDLRSATGGRGTSSLMDQYFAKLPDELQSDVKEEIRNRKGLSEGE